MASSNSIAAPMAKKIRGKFSWPEASSIKQFFILPSSILYYLARNPPNQKMYLKMIKISKYFFETNPILIVDSMKNNELCSYYDNSEIDFNKTLSKIWLRGRYLFLSNSIPNICSKFYRYEVKKLYLGTQFITMNEFIFLSCTATTIDLNHVVFNQNENVVMFEEILESIPHVEEFSFCFGENNLSMVSDLTIKNMANLKRFENLKSFSLMYFPENFKFGGLMNFMIKYDRVEFCFYFNQNISQEAKAEIDDVIDSGCLCHIQYDGQDEEKLMIMEQRYNNYYEYGFWF